MIVYISGKITDNENYKQDFQKAEMWLALNDIIPLNPARLNESFPNLTYQQYMLLDYELIKMADAIYMIGGWQDSKGACAELTFAKSLGKEIIYQKHYKEFKSCKKTEL